MSDLDPNMKIINPAKTKPALSDDAKSDIAALVARQNKAGTVLMKVISFAGGQVEDALKMLPEGARTRLESGARDALVRSYDLAGRSRSVGVKGDRANKVLASVSGALGGLGGLPTALAELPVATTLIFRAVQDVAESLGEDPTAPETRVECLRVFGSGGPGDADDGIDTTFVGARLSLTGPAVNKLIQSIAPKFATLLGQKLASQAVPVLGAAAGAGTNFAFTSYYVEMAQVHFGLRALARIHDEADVLDEFHRQLAASKLPVIRN
ncbi:EcsC family protein [Aestuariibius sp. HNIBRBA575]|uniref:EcsC family protein n=1 Tax=Aestuariibius sp. HNIBRBA575 TaxID=3233343 RepID=UPI0034A4FD5B